jgi:hypothetical protein
MQFAFIYSLERFRLKILPDFIQKLFLSDFDAETF